uniref:Uncharacterized protein n=1 Tax=Caenorhabditis japonica TaxID=281687 RepID=A0A8R1IQ92_CAEJA
MIGRADIEGSKSNVAMDAWLPQASYPCEHWAEISDSQRPQGPSVTSVLIRQSDSLSPYRFQFSRLDERSGY